MSDAATFLTQFIVGCLIGTALGAAFCAFILEPLIDVFDAWLDRRFAIPEPEHSSLSLVEMRQFHDAFMAGVRATREDQQ